MKQESRSWKGSMWRMGAGLNFYLDQSGERKQQIGCLDQKHSVRKKKWHERKEREKSLENPKPSTSSNIR